ncbi:uncharacterized protein LOC122294956 [Carya illinoinensis]|uniref:PAP/OAS1 substrate-binding-related domain-containing protein n=1 Tax=Carya illinoinensis TaxID=32201 RepID=A0A922AHA4_CARIL|nr:uncharacterized protein LOC122294956 [Carya illinoinensis]XP_042959878.1 uncharacterized protein LOC122294956 [Carya illinoinensis]XP_042959879.1 uncharacterized protein LOC122294956 [Carya illinoinensis]XP_042959880.1 uncharacterized protein LOC122294956 [Carya illinoinensis]KAG6677943.1 hypothetical protein I3842_14G053800 [Carya illinoinensis]
MGEVQVLVDDRLSAASPPLPASNPDPGSIATESLDAAERVSREIVSSIHPTLAADHKRKGVIEYVQGLVRSCIGCEVFPYGSVPLKTYLPDGDIDLTAISCPNIEDSLVSDVYTVLKGEEHNEAAPYEVKDVHSIHAEVKLVKCIVQNIVVDISFNQLGGLCTLCFLEQVDRLVGKDHLFKRSVILIKAWCYYESRLLGAHHNLISTYALETLIVYVFHLFHSSLNGPLAVLYRFLDYFGKFDWENYCISLSGPVCKSSLPDIIVEAPKDGGDDLLLSEEFLRNCVERFSVPTRGLETNSRAFPQKHLNIIDPLKENNNLGRSVNRGNFYRIRSAFKYGARKLGHILLLPRERIANELHMFFSNTLDRHGRTWNEMQSPFLASGAIGSDLPFFSFSPVLCSEKNMVLDSTFGFNNDKISGVEVESGIRHRPKRNLRGVVSSELVPELDRPVNRNTNVRSRYAGNDKELANSGTLGLGISKASSDYLPLKSKSVTLVLGNSDHATHSNNLALFRKNGKIKNWNPCWKMPANSVKGDEMGSALQPEVKEDHLAGRNLFCSCINQEGVGSPCSVFSGLVSNLSPCNRNRCIAGVLGSSEALKCFLDLNADYDSHLRSLQYGQLCHGYAVFPPILPSPSTSTRFTNISCETICESPQIKQDFHAQTKKNGVALGPGVYPMSHPTFSCATYGLEEKKKRLGTGTYFPNANYHYRGRQVPQRNYKVEAHGQLQRCTHNNGLAPAPQELNVSIEGSHKLSHDEFPVLGHGNSGSLDSHQSHLSKWGPSNANGLSRPSDKLESGSLCPRSLGAPLPESSSQQESCISHLQGSASSPVVPAVQSPKLLPEINEERAEVQLYHLKDEDDFPPLSHCVPLEG